MSQDIFLPFFVVAIGPLLFYALFKKAWADSEIRKTAAVGLALGFIGVIAAKLLYYPIEVLLGTGIKDYLQSDLSWWSLLLVSIGIVGLVEEGAKTAMGLIATYKISFKKRRPTAIFLGFAGCGIGFSAMENLQYYFAYGVEVILPRMVISTSAHLFFTCFCGIFVAVSFARNLSNSKLSLNIAIGTVLAAISHGIFDFLIFRLDLNDSLGLLLSLNAFFLYGIYEFWIKAKAEDLPEKEELLICSGCGAFCIGRARFCNFCGNRVVNSGISSDFKIKK